MLQTFNILNIWTSLTKKSDKIDLKLKSKQIEDKH
jgi:hypothetical protein